ncbi:unnamed protein product [Dicrocoelium dendriticum]|nr:unnamed protein product [Dicrocoelium dendriticum]
MSLDLNSNGDSLRSSVDSVLNGAHAWVVFGYSGTSFTLDVVNSGSDTKDMLEEFSSHRVMFGFVRVDHSGQASLPPKYVFIYWCGEAAPSKYKVSCTQHGDVIKQFCRTTHLSIRAQSEDDLDWDDVVAKLTKISGTDYSVRPDKWDWHPPNVESTYRRVDPLKEIPKNSSSKDFWRNQQAAVSLPTANKPQLPVRSNCPVNGRPSRTLSQESKTTRNVELHSTLSNRGEQNASSPNNHVISAYRKINPRDEIIQARKLSNTSSDPLECTTTTSSGYKKIDPRAEIMLARKLSQVQCEDEDQIHIGTSWKRADPRAEIAEARRLASGSCAANGSPSSDHTHQNSGIPSEFCAARGGKVEGTVSNVVLPSSIYEPNGSSATGMQGVGERLNSSSTSMSSPDQLPGIASSIHNLQSAIPSSGVASDSVAQPASACNLPGPVVVCLYNYTAADDDELSFAKGDQIFHIQQIDEGWWLGMTADGRRGLFPANYVELVA